MEEAVLAFDVGKTNKKAVLFDASLRVMRIREVEILEQSPGHGLLADDVAAIEQWMLDELRAVASEGDIRLRAINIATFGATVAHLDAHNALACPVYSYECDPGEAIDQQFREIVSRLEGGFHRRATPPLPQFLNVAKQLLWLNRSRPDVAQRIRTTLFLPQYFAFRLSGSACSEPTGFGCHTGLWDFERMQPDEELLTQLGWRNRFPALVDPLRIGFPLSPSLASATGLEAKATVVGSGLHDSSSALLPYELALQDDFVLVSTGTWIVVLNPGAPFRLSDEDLRRDRLYYLSPRRQPVRASRLFAGREHDVQLQRIEAHFGRSPQPTGDVAPLLPGFFAEPAFRGLRPQVLSGSGPFPHYPVREWDLSAFDSAEEAYARLCLDLAVLVDYCISEVATERIRQVVIDGGFARNPWFTQILAMLQQPTPVMVAEVPQATALGAALAVRSAMGGELPPMDALLHLHPIEAQVLPGLRLYAEHLLARWETESFDHEDERRTP